MVTDSEKSKILIIDDEQSIREFLELFFIKEKYLVTVCDNGRDALNLLKQTQFDLVFLDIQMPEMSGMEVLSAIKKIDSTIEVIMITAFSSTETAVEAIKNAAYDYITKPFKLDELSIITKKALEKRNLTRENLSLKAQLGERYSFQNIVGSSQQMQTLFEMIRIVSQTTSNVLVTGESGTGKELIAKAIHYNGPLRNSPFVAVDCGAIPENLIESEMFGHKRGSFTGAISDKIGLFEIANKGTIFLDEVGEIPLHLQAKLLRSLQERIIRRIGDTEDINIEVRVIAATNKNLHDMTKAGKFRDDLFYRLNVIQVQAPPLRTRGDDIILLAKHFAEKYSKKLFKNITSISDSVLKVLRDYDYPGNVRELENIIERAVALSADDKIKLKDLPAHIQEFKPEEYQKDKKHIDIYENGIELDKLLAEYERDIIVKALQKTGGIKKKAAKLLGISFRSIRYRLEKLGLE